MSGYCVQTSLLGPWAVSLPIDTISLPMGYGGIFILSFNCGKITTNLITSTCPTSPVCLIYSMPAVSHIQNRMVKPETFSFSILYGDNILS